MTSPLRISQKILGFLPLAASTRLWRCLILSLILGLSRFLAGAEFLTPHAISITPSLNEGLEMVLSVPHDRRYAVHSTDDFQTWTELGANAATNGIFTFLDRRVSVMMVGPFLCSFEAPDCFLEPPIFRMRPQIRFYRLLDLSAPESLTGKVVDAQGNPISGARISMIGGMEMEAISDDLGAFTLQSHSTAAQPQTRVFVADASGYVRGFAQPTYSGTTPHLDFRLAPQKERNFAPETLTGRTILFTDPNSAIATVTFTDNFRTDSGAFYVPVRSGDDFMVYEIVPSGVFQTMLLTYGFDGAGELSPRRWDSDGSYAIFVNVPLLDATDAATPPETLHNHQVDLTFLHFLNEIGVGQWHAKLDLVGGNSGQFNISGFLENGTARDYTYSVQNKLATITFLSDPPQGNSSLSLVFTSPSEGRFIFSHPATRTAYAGIFQNFTSKAASIDAAAKVPDGLKLKQ